LGANHLHCRYFRLFAIERISPDTPYLHVPRSIEEYREMAEVADAPLLNIITIPPPTINGTEALPYTAAQVHAVLSQIAPAVAALSSAGLLGRAYVYGFDERPHTKSWIAAINQIFGAVKEQWSKLKTVAALRWSVRLPSAFWSHPLPFPPPLGRHSARRRKEDHVRLD
jgi:hypothetical protein